MLGSVVFELVSPTLGLDLVDAWELSAGRNPLVSAETSLVLLSGEHPTGASSRPPTSVQRIVDLSCLASSDLLELDALD